MLLCPGTYTERVLPTSTLALPCLLPVAFVCWETWAVIKKKNWMPFSQVEHQSNSITNEMIGILSRVFLIFFFFISTVLEGSTVSVFIPGKKYGEDADQQVSFPVQCSFWALTDASRQSGKMSENVLIGTTVSLLFCSIIKGLIKLRM